MQKDVIILASIFALVSAQTTEYGNGEYLCSQANDIISRCSTDPVVPATANALKECYCSWDINFDDSLTGCWQYIETATSYISPVETPEIPIYEGYCHPVTAPGSASTTSSASSTSFSLTPSNSTISSIPSPSVPAPSPSYISKPSTTSTAPVPPPSAVGAASHAGVSLAAALVGVVAVVAMAL